MNVLHICNAYQTNTLYQKLFKCLSDLGVHQEVLAPGTNDGEFIKDDVRVIFFKRNKNFLFRLLWPLKIFKLVSFAQENYKIDQFHLIHAHTLFSDGTVAYLLSKKHKGSYVVAVRNTDLNDFFTLPLFKQLGYKILLNASAVYLISEANKKQLGGLLPQKIKDKIWNKVFLLPNGIDEYWLSNIYKRQKHTTQSLKLIYAGDICENKNIHNVIEAIKLKDICTIDSYEAIGLKETDQSEYVERLKVNEKQTPSFHLNGRCNKEELLTKFREADIYIQPSFTETFGLSYIEALTQGLPVIYSRGQGIDGMFEEGKVGYAVNPNSPQDIIDKLAMIRNRYEELLINIGNIDFQKFSWKEIAKDYYKNYTDMYS